MPCYLLRKYYNLLDSNQLFSISEHYFNNSMHYYLCDKKIHSKNSENKIKIIIRLLKEGYLIEHLIGKANFAGNLVPVQFGGFIPRDFSEKLIEIALGYIRKKSYTKMSILELFAGSGAITIALMKKLQNKTIDYSLVEMNHELLSHIKSDNVNIFNTHNKLKKSSKFDLIIANPPYIPSDSLKSIMKNLIKHENKDSFISDGLHRTILYQVSKEYLKKGGLIVFEHWLGEIHIITKIFKNYSIYGVYNDNSLVNRFTALIKN